MAELHAIHGAALPSTGESVRDVVALLEGLLGLAKSGSIVGVAVATVSNQGGLSTGWAAQDGSRNQMGTAISMMQHRYYTNLLEDAP